MKVEVAIEKDLKKLPEWPYITNIQHFSVHDGPGFRTLIFVKGCNLRCEWCHNPETQKPYPELYWKPMLCRQCGRCVDACPYDAINPPIPPEIAQDENSDYYKIRLDKCTLCMKCVDACLYEALTVVGKKYTIEELITEVEKDRPFYDNSGGGLTLSGGEPTLFPKFSEELLRAAKERYIHTCLDTNGFCKWSVLERLIEYTDIVLYDLKHLDPEKHKERTGADNKVILRNLERLLETDIEVWIRQPIIPDYNDSMEYHLEVIEYLKSLPRMPDRVDLLPFHNWCESKYRWLGRKWSMADIEAMDPKVLRPIKDMYAANGFRVTIGGSGFEKV